jgi:hypothetical protein
MKEMTPEEIEAEIKRRNELWAAATKEEKRVLLAQDVLDQLESKKLLAGIGAWIRYYDSPNPTDSEDLRTAYFQGGSCAACAIGSLLISCTLFNNNQTLKDVKFGGVLHDFGSKYKIGEFPANGLTDLFTAEELIEIECAFEPKPALLQLLKFDAEDAFKEHMIPEEYKTAREMYSRNYGAENRLRLIMENIIENKGMFRPSIPE